MEYQFLSNNRWLLCVNDANYWESDGFNGETVIPNPHHFAMTLDCIKILYEKYVNIPKEHPWRNHLIVTKSLWPNPVCDKSNGIVYLVPHGADWVSYSYQFSHEICHFLINVPIVDNFRWFEEAICTTASFFFLKGLYAEWNNNDI